MVNAIVKGINNILHFLLIVFLYSFQFNNLEYAYLQMMGKYFIYTRVFLKLMLCSQLTM